MLIKKAATKKIEGHVQIENNGNDMDDDGSVGSKLPPRPALSLHSKQPGFS